MALTDIWCHSAWTTSCQTCPVDHRPLSGQRSFGFVGTQLQAAHGYSDGLCGKKRLSWLSDSELKPTWKRWEIKRNPGQGAVGQIEGSLQGKGLFDKQVMKLFHHAVCFSGTWQPVVEHKSKHSLLILGIRQEGVHILLYESYGGVQ